MFLICSAVVLALSPNISIELAVACITTPRSSPDALDALRIAGIEPNVCLAVKPRLTNSVIALLIL